MLQYIEKFTFQNLRFSKLLGKLYNYRNGERTYLTMEVIADELRKNNVYIDRTILSQHIHYILDNYRDTYNNAVNRVNSAQLLNIYNEMNVNTVGRAMAYLTLVYRMNIPEEDTVREAVRLVVPTLKNIARVEGSFIRRLCSGVGYALYLWNAS